jgi:hypothetical protein
VSDNSNDQKGFIPIKELEIQYPPSQSLPSRRRRKDFYISDSSDEKINEEISVEGIDGDETDGEEGDSEKTDKAVNIEEDIEEVIKEVGEKVVRTRNNKEVKRVRISLFYYEEMKDRRKKDLEYKIKFKIARRRRD